MTDPIASVLREIAGPDLYRLNSFRITGLSTYADRRTVRQRQQRVVPALALGADIDLNQTVAVEPDQIKAAFDHLLEDPRRRLADEMFWLWDAPGATCSCPPALHHLHDAATMAHCHALDQEILGDRSGRARPDLDELWADAARQWKEVLRRAATWEHVRHRLRALDDRRLDESVVDTLRAELPRTLIRTVVDLAVAADHPARLAGYAVAWPGPETLAGDLLEEAAAPLFDALSDAMVKGRELLEAGRPGDGGAVIEQAVPTLDRLEELLPHDRYRRTKVVREDVAIALNNCATSLFEESGIRVADQADELFQSALDLATEAEGRDTIERNRELFDQVTEAVEYAKMQARMLIAAGQVRNARRYLLAVRNQLAAVPGAKEEIDELLAEAGGRPTYDDYAETPSRSWGAGRVMLVVVLVLIAVLLLIRACDTPDGPTDSGQAPTVEATSVDLFGPSATTSAPVGSCLREFVDVREPMPVVDCRQPHTAEILGYPRLAGNGEPWTPGDERLREVASAACQRVVGSQQFPSGVQPGVLLPDDDRLNEPGQYVVCVAYRADGGQTTGPLR